MTWDQSSWAAARAIAILLLQPRTRQSKVQEKNWKIELCPLPRNRRTPGARRCETRRSVYSNKTSSQPQPPDGCTGKWTGKWLSCLLHFIVMAVSSTVRRFLAFYHHSPAEQELGSSGQAGSSLASTIADAIDGFDLCRFAQLNGIICSLTASSGVW